MTDTINVPRELLEKLCEMGQDAIQRMGSYLAEKYNEQQYIDAAHALLKAPAQPAQVQGWQMVPVEPTPEMMKAARSVPEPVKPYPAHYSLIWDAMLAAAPKAECDECGGNGSGGEHEDDCSKAPKPPVQECEAPSCGCADAYCKAWDEAPQPSDDAKDAARYRWLRERGDAFQWENILRFDLDEFVCADNALDAAMAGGSHG